MEVFRNGGSGSPGLRGEREGLPRGCMRIFWGWGVRVVVEGLERGA